MRHLLAKDVRLVAPYLWIIVPAHALWCLQASLSPYLYLWMSLAAALGWTAAIVAIEWRTEADRVVASLPVTRAGIVQARYTSALGGLALGAVLYLLYGHAVRVMASEAALSRLLGEAAWALDEGAVAFVAVGYVLLIGFLPFLFRFGLPLGAAVFSALTGVLVSAAMGISRLAGFSWSLAGAALSAWPTALALVAAASALGAFSVWLSVRFYEGRDL